MQKLLLECLKWRYKVGYCREKVGKAKMAKDLNFLKPLLVLSDPARIQTWNLLISSQLLRKKPNAASQAFRYAANALQRSNHWLAHYFRRMKTKDGNK